MTNKTITFETNHGYCKNTLDIGRRYILLKQEMVQDKDRFDILVYHKEELLKLIGILQDAIQEDDK